MMPTSREIIDTYFHPEKVAPFDRWLPKRCVWQNADDDGNTEMAEKVDYLKHASLVHPLSVLGMLVGQEYDVGSLNKSKNSINIRKRLHLQARKKSITSEKQFNASSVHIKIKMETFSIIICFKTMK